MPLADAAALKLLQGVFVMILAVLLLRERVSAGQALAAALCLGGAFVIVTGTAGRISADSLLAAGAAPLVALLAAFLVARSEEHTSELQSLMRYSYAVFCLKQKTPT